LLNYIKSELALIQHETLELLEWPRLCQHLSTFAATKLGAIASRHLPIPQTKEESIELLQQTQEVYYLDQKLDKGLSFEGIQDIGLSLERAKIGGMLSGAELLNIATTLAGVRRLRRVIEEQENVPTLQSLIEQVRTYPELEQEIHHCIDDRGEVTDRASEKLAGLRVKSKEFRGKISKILHNILQRQANSLQELVITQRGDRFVIPVKAGQKEQIPGIVHDISSTGSTLYIEPNAIIQLGNNLTQIQRQERREVEAILTALTAKITEVEDDLEVLLVCVTKIDLATAKARYSLWLEANPPRFIDDEEIVTLRSLRHPLLAWQHQHEQGSAVIPITVTIKPEIKVVAITGPNTGGKTVTLKTMGLAALMAKVGLFLPAKEPVELPWFGNVLADIGDEQSLEQSLSTFSGHIRRISRIISAIETETAPFLILLDEVGAGTDPAEGSALAIALLKYLADHVKLTIATTHYGELKALKYQDSRFENASVEFDDNSLQPTYRLLWGIPGRSNALTIAQRLGLKPEIVSVAQDQIGGYSGEVNQVIAGLEAQRREQEQKAETASQLLQKTERFYAEVSQKALELKERERELKLSQEKAIQDAINQAKAEIAKVIKTLQQGPQIGQNAQKATEKLNKIGEQYLPVVVTPKKPGYKPKIGEKIRIPRLEQTAEVIALEDNEQITVRFGMMKMTIPLTDIESLDGQKVEVPVKQVKTVSPSPSPKTNPVTIRTSQNTLDLRGSRVHNAEIELDQAIATGSATGSTVLWIIHGKGTGKLREGIHQFLKTHSQVEKFELAADKDGGSGVTIAYLR
jgi:DNA mismatch repair protein MutS2